jgi:hypothetical protein
VPIFGYRISVRKLQIAVTVECTMPAWFYMLIAKMITTKASIMARVCVSVHGTYPARQRCVPNCGAIPAHTIFIDVHTKARSLEDIYMAAGSWNWRG